MRAARERASLEAALSLWRGRALAEVAYESFAQGEIARLEELRLIAHEQLLEMRLAQGGHALVIPELERLAAAHPSRERVISMLMLALYRGGRQADALDLYQHGRRRLDEDLGLSPHRRCDACKRRSCARTLSWRFLLRLRGWRRRLRALQATVRSPPSSRGPRRLLVPRACLCHQRRQSGEARISLGWKRWPPIRPFSWSPSSGRPAWARHPRDRACARSGRPCSGRRAFRLLGTPHLARPSPLHHRPRFGCRRNPGRKCTRRRCRALRDSRHVARP